MPLHTTRAVWKCACMQAMRATGVAYRLTVATFATAGRGFIPVAAQRPLNWVGLAGFAAAAKRRCYVITIDKSVHATVYAVIAAIIASTR